eukprot:369670-Amphidinium_carterae.1
MMPPHAKPLRKSSLDCEHYYVTCCSYDTELEKACGTRLARKQKATLKSTTAVYCFGQGAHSVLPYILTCGDSLLTCIAKHAH